MRLFGLPLGSGVVHSLGVRPSEAKWGQVMFLKCPQVSDDGSLLWPSITPSNERPHLVGKNKELWPWVLPLCQGEKCGILEQKQKSAGEPAVCEYSCEHVFCYFPSQVYFWSVSLETCEYGEVLPSVV